MKNVTLLAAGLAAAALLCLTCDNTGGNSPGDDGDANSFVNKFHNPAGNPNDPCVTNPTPDCPNYVNPCVTNPTPDCPNYVNPCETNPTPNCPNYVNPCETNPTPDCPNYCQVYECPPPADNTFVDSRDGKTYKKVKIGTQTWMAENLNYDIPNVPSDVCYNNDQTYCDKYGRLYNWSDAMNNVSSSSENPSGVQGACPAGWHLPSDREWAALINYIGSFAGERLRAKDGWNTSTVVGKDEFGFAALPGGYIGTRYGTYGSYNVYSDGYWWSTTANGATYAYSYQMNYGSRDVTRDYYGIGYLYSVRCVQN